MFDLASFPLASPLVVTLVTAPVLAIGWLTVLGLRDGRERTARLGRSLGRGQPPAPRRHRPSPRAQVLALLSRLAQGTAERVSIMRGNDADASAMLLRGAGIYRRDAVVIYAFLKLVLPVAGLLLAGLWLLVLRRADTTPLVAVIVLCTVALTLSKLPDTLLSMRRKRRFESVRRAFPDMLELLVIASEAGLSAGPALSRVARELRDTAPALSFEMEQLVVELNVLPSRSTAWTQFGDRLPLTEVSVFANALLQAERHGSPFAGALRTLMKEERANRLLRVEEQAGRIPALMTVPLILFIMPALFVVLIGPAVLNILDNILTGGFG